MYTTTLASAYVFQLPSAANYKRTLIATVLFALGALVGWPFALAISIPFVFEEIFLLGADRVDPKDRVTWAGKRFLRLVQCGFVASLIIVRQTWHFSHLVLRIFPRSLAFWLTATLTAGQRWLRGTSSSTTFSEALNVDLTFMEPRLGIFIFRI